MLIMSRSGPRRYISRSARTRQARSGLRAAVATKGVFHLWTHPFNLASDRSHLLSWLEDIIVDAVGLRDLGSIAIATMAEIAERSASSSGQTSLQTSGDVGSSPMTVQSDEAHDGPIRRP
jgi:hypothetical protein